MRRTIITISVIFVVMLGLIILAESMAPKKVNWEFTGSTHDKIPLGMYVFNEEATNIFKGQEIDRFSLSPYEYFDGIYDYENNDYLKKGTYLKITPGNEMDYESAKELLNYADYGNTVFLSMPDFPYVILDTLGLETASFNLKDSLITVSLTAEKNKEYKYGKGSLPTYFKGLNKSNDSITIKGYEKVNDTLVPNYIEAKFGYGKIILHTQPVAFTNYYLLNGENKAYTEKLVSDIPEGAVLWQTDNATYQNQRGTLDYFLNQPAFHAFWVLGIWGILIFIFFNARRRQRVVPIIEPVSNTSVAFTKTIGNLYFQEGDHHTIIHKKIIYFLEHLRTEYHIDTYSLDDKFVEKLHAKTGKPVDDIKNVIKLIQKHRSIIGSTENDVAEINNAIEKLRL